MIEDNKRDEGQASQNPQQFNSTRNSDDNEILNGGGGVDSRSTHSAEYDRGDSSANSSSGHNNQHSEYGKLENDDEDDDDDSDSEDFDEDDSEDNENDEINPRRTPGL